MPVVDSVAHLFYKDLQIRNQITAWAARKIESGVNLSRDKKSRSQPRWARGLVGKLRGLLGLERTQVCASLLRRADDFHLFPVVG